MKKLLALIAAAAMAAAMTACNGDGSGESRQVNGTAAEAEPAVHDYTYVTPSGIEYSGSYTGGWENSQLSGIGERSYYYNDEEAVKYGFDRKVYKGEFSDSEWNGEGELTVYYTEEFAELIEADYIVYTGQTKDGSFVEPYRYAYYKNNQPFEEGRVMDGKHVSDTEKASGDLAYDLVDDALGGGNAE